MSVLSHRGHPQGPASLQAPLQIHYEALGRGAPIIFIHSWLGSWRYWWPAMQALSHNFRTFAFDLWGFGSSSRCPDCYSLEAYVEMVQALVDGLGMAQPVTLVGHGLGAAIAVRYTRLYPQRVARLATVSLPLHRNDSHLEPVPAGPASADWLPQAGHPQGMPLQSWANYSELSQEFKKADGAAISKILQEFDKIDFTADLVSLRLPRLIIAGADDPVVRPPGATASATLDGDANCGFVLLSDAGHFPMLEQAATFNRLLTDFMHGLEAAPKAYWQRRTR